MMKRFVRLSDRTRDAAIRVQEAFPYDNMDTTTAIAMLVEIAELAMRGCALRAVKANGKTCTLNPNPDSDWIIEFGPKNTPRLIRRVQARRTAPPTARDRAWADLQELLANNTRIDKQKQLADRWGVSEATVSRWMKEWNVTTWDMMLWSRTPEKEVGR